MRIACYSESLRRGVAVLAAAAGLVLAAAPAQAQTACQDPSDVVEGVYDAFYDEVGDEFFALGDDAVCNKITKTMLAACHKAVSSAVKCYQQLYKSILSGQKTACTTEGSDKAECNAYFSDRNAGVQEEIAGAGEQGDYYCDLYADEFSGFCFYGLP